MAAHKNRLWTPDTVRRRIRTGVLITKLKNHALGKCEMTQTQVAAAKILLAKIVPDLRAIEHSGEVTHHHAGELTDSELTNLATGSGNRAAETTPGAKKPGDVH